MAADVHSIPWERLPEDIVATLRPALVDIVPELIATIQREVPEYSRPMEGSFGDGIRRGVGVALERFLVLPGTREPALTDASRQVYRGLGRGEVRQGRSLDSLLAAYRTGARVVFRGLADRVTAAGGGTDVIIALGESIFAYIDEVSAASVEGYALEQSDRATDLDRRRGEIVSLLLAGGADRTTLQRLAALAGWRLPDDVRVVALGLDHSSGLRLALGPECLVLVRATETVAVVPSAHGRAELARALEGRGAVVGPSRPWPQAPESARLALSLAALRASRPDGPPGREAQAATSRTRGIGPAWVDDALLDVILGAEPGAVADLARRRLRPLEAERPGSRERLLETLLAWLAHDGRRTAVGAALHIHPQTVGYRVARLRELFGDDLDDPRARFELELVLRARATDR